MREVKITKDNLERAEDAHRKTADKYASDGEWLEKALLAAAPYLQEEVVVTDEDVEAYRGSSTSFDTVANSPLLAKAIQRVFDRRNALNAPNTAKDLLRENFKRVHYSLSDSELDQLIAIAEAFAQPLPPHNQRRRTPMANEVCKHCGKPIYVCVFNGQWVHEGGWQACFRTTYAAPKETLCEK